VQVRERAYVPYDLALQAVSRMQAELAEVRAREKERLLLLKDALLLDKEAALKRAKADYEARLAAVANGRPIPPPAAAPAPAAVAAPVTASIFADSVHHKAPTAAPDVERKQAEESAAIARLDASHAEAERLARQLADRDVALAAAESERTRLQAEVARLQQEAKEAHAVSAASAASAASATSGVGIGSGIKPALAGSRGPDREGRSLSVKFAPMPDETSEGFVPHQPQQQAQSLDSQSHEAQVDALQGEVDALRAALATARELASAPRGEAAALVLPAPVASAAAGRAAGSSGAQQESVARVSAPLRALLTTAQDTVRDGEVMWLNREKAEALDLYRRTVAALAEALLGLSIDEGDDSAQGHDCAALAEPLVLAVADADEKVEERQPAKATIALKLALDQFIVSAMELLMQYGLESRESLPGLGPKAPTSVPVGGSARPAGPHVDPQALAAAEDKAAQASMAAIAAERAASNAESALTAARARIDAAERESQSLKEQLAVANESALALEQQIASLASFDYASTVDPDTEDTAAVSEPASTESAGVDAPPPVSVTPAPAPAPKPAPASGAKGTAAPTANAALAAKEALAKQTAKLQEQDRLIREMRVKTRQLESSLSQAQAAIPIGPVFTEKEVESAVEKKAAALEKKFKKEIDEAEKVCVIVEHSYARLMLHCYSFDLLVSSPRSLLARPAGTSKGVRRRIQKGYTARIRSHRIYCADRESHFRT
jgi:hypothetical protein